MKYFFTLLGAAGLIGLDQISKYWVTQHLTMYEYHPIFGDIFGLFYLENSGIAWGMFQNRQYLFILLSILVVIFLVFCYVRLIHQPKFLPLNLCILFLTSGAVGNMIDRIFHGDALFQGAVVDFLYIQIIHFPVFNLADMFVTFSFAAAMILLIFRYKDEDFQELKNCIFRRS